MKQLGILLVGIFCALPLAGRACSSCGDVPVKFHGEFCAKTTYDITLNSTKAHGDGQGCHKYTQSSSESTKLKPNEEYDVQITAGGASSIHVVFSTEDCYKILISSDSSGDNFSETDTFDDHTDSCDSSYDKTIRIKVVPKLDNGGPGTGGNGKPTMGSVRCWFSMGGLPNGGSAGTILIAEKLINANSYSPNILHYSSPSPLVSVVRDANGYLRQIKAPEVLADVVTVNSQKFEIRYYLASAVGSLVNGLYQTTGTPFTTWTLESPSGATVGTKLRITQTRGAVVIPHEFSYDAATGSWSLTEAGLREETRSYSTLGNGDKQVIVIIRNPTSGIVSSKKKEIRHTFPWGEEIISSVEDPDGNALATGYEFYQDPSNGGSYGRLKSVTYPDGNWEKYEYYSDGNYYPFKGGKIYRIYRPWKDSPSSPSQATFGNCRVTERYYESSGSAFATFLSSEYGYILGTEVSDHDFNTSDYYVNGMPARSETVPRPGGNETTVTYKYEAPQPYSNQIASVTYADGRTENYTYEFGTYNATSGAFTPGTGSFVRQTLTRGTVNSASGIANKTTRTVTVRDPGGNVLLEDEQVYTGGTSYQSIAQTKYTYNTESKLTQKTLNGRVILDNVTWVDGRKTQETDEYGITTTYSNYDGLSRLIAKSRAGITTTYGYDADSRLLSTTRSAGALSLSATTGYDLAGRVTSETSEGGLSTGIAYTAGGRITTRTLPNTGTEITEQYLDGQVKSITGTAGVSQNYDYGAETDRIWTKMTLGSSGVRYEKSWRDSFGNVTKMEKPAYSGVSTTSYTYDSEGRVRSQSVPGEASVLSEYDPDTGEVLRTGRDIDGDGILTLGGKDRINQTDISYQLTSGSWSRVTTQSQYETDDSSTPTVISTVTENLSGLASNVQSRVSIKDRYNQTTTNTVTIDRSTKTVTETTDTPDSNINAVRITVNGLLQSATTPTVAQPTTYDVYDGLGRIKQVTDPRGVQTTYNYDSATGQLSSVTTAGKTTSYDYYQQNQVGAGQIKSTFLMGSARVYQDYNLRGQVVHTWGGTAYPTELTYDPQYGDRTGLTTFRAGTGWDTATSWPGSSGGDITTWGYQASTGLLLSKTDALNRAVSYTYYPSGRMHTRTWARGTSTTYHYNSAGDLILTDYSDATPDVSASYDRVGRQKTLSDAAGSHSFTYTNAQNTETIASGGLLGGTTLTTTFDAYGRKSGITAALGTWSENSAYGYDSQTGRLQTVTYGTRTATYAYQPNSDLLYTTTLKDSGATRLTLTRGWDTSNRLQSMTNAWTGGSQSYDTGANFDAMNRRQKVTWADGSWWDYGYDGRGEVTSGSRKWSGGGTVAGQQYGYTFDNIGNRLTATVNGRTSTYTPNSLNQYTQRTVPGAYDILGTAAASATITVGGVSLGANDRNGTYFYKEVSVANTSSPVSQTSSVVATLSGSSSTRNITKYVPKTPESFGYDLDGNLQSDGSWVYTWDGENRLIGMDNSSIAGIPTAAKRKLAFTYDTQGRRIRAQVWYPNPNNSGTLLLHHTIRYLYDGWNLVAEIGDTGRRIRTYAWGQDVSGSLSRAGGIGGLLFETQSYSGKVSGMGYDLNGNVTALVDMANGAAVAQYEYGPFGEAIRQSGDYAELNPIRFSSKYQDNETGLLYYGYRFYNPGIGRWLSRDPSGERDLPNLYGYIKNSPIMNLDPLGLQHYDYNPGRLKPRKPAGTVRNISGVPAYTMHLYLFQEFWQRAQYPYMLTVSSEDTYVFGGSFLDQVKDQDSVLDHYDEMKNRVANDARDMLDEGRATDPETSFEDGDSDTITANDINVVLALGEFTLIWDAQCDIHCGETVKYNCKIKWSVRDLYDFPWWNVPYSLIGGVPFHDAGDWTDEENGTVK